MRTIDSTPSPQLSVAKEDYVRAIYLLQNKSDGSASVTQVATRLGLRKSTVSGRMKDLMKEGLVKNSSYSKIVLTARGEEVAETLTYKHRLMEVFLNRVLDMPAEAVHGEAEKLEHACSDDVIQRLAHFLDYPTTDPHGTEISTPKHW
jgi:DtxR family Mn-dependent transcriptional regulator